MKLLNPIESKSNKKNPKKSMILKIRFINNLMINMDYKL